MNLPVRFDIFETAHSNNSFRNSSSLLTNSILNWLGHKPSFLPGLARTSRHAQTTIKIPLQKHPSESSRHTSSSDNRETLAIRHTKPTDWVRPLVSLSSGLHLQLQDAAGQRLTHNYPPSEIVLAGDDSKTASAQADFHSIRSACEIR